MRYWQAPKGRLLHSRLGLITVCGKRIGLTSWVTVRQTPPPTKDELCPACQRREDFREIAPYINDPRGWIAPDTLHIAKDLAAREAQP